MARLGTARVTDVLDYERNIKGKRLIRLRAGVGAGKNYWVRHMPEKYPDLQILMITSRKNVAEDEAIRLNIDTKIHITQLTVQWTVTDTSSKSDIYYSFCQW